MELEAYLEEFASKLEIGTEKVKYKPYVEILEQCMTHYLASLCHVSQDKEYLSAIEQSRKHIVYEKEMLEEAIRSPLTMIPFSLNYLQENHANEVVQELSFYKTVLMYDGQIRFLISEFGQKDVMLIQASADDPTNISVVTTITNEGKFIIQCNEDDEWGMVDCDENYLCIEDGLENIFGIVPPILKYGVKSNFIIQIGGIFTPVPEIYIAEDDSDKNVYSGDILTEKDIKILHDAIATWDTVLEEGKFVPLDNESYMLLWMALEMIEEILGYHLKSWTMYHELIAAQEEENKIMLSIGQKAAEYLAGEGIDICQKLMRNIDCQMREHKLSTNKILFMTNDSVYIQLEEEISVEKSFEDGFIYTAFPLLRRIKIDESNPTLIKITLITAVADLERFLV